MEHINIVKKINVFLVFWLMVLSMLLLPSLSRASFTDISAGLPSVGVSSAAWGDYDNDGDLDILLAGYGASGPVSKVYRNDGGIFTDISAGLTGAYFSSTAWGDYDNDGDLDILITGDTGSGYTSRVYRNDSGTFTDISAGLTGVSYGSGAWGDFDNDGDLDILITGHTGSGYISRVYRNDGGTFTDISAGLAEMGQSSGSWGDFDNDGDLDILITGYNGSGYNSRVYRNDSGTFTDISAGLTGVYYSSAAWGDYDNDGDLDILITGVNGTATLTQLYRNDGGTFTDISAGLTGVHFSSAAWGDYDNDGDLDILITGINGLNNISRVYRNDGPDPNQPPGAPDNLTGVQEGDNGFLLSWQAASDNETPADGLGYNLRVGTDMGAIDVAAPMSDTSSGLRRIAEIGPRRGTSALIKDLSANTLYHWSVQAVDTTLAGGPFAEEGCFRLNNQAPTVTDITQTIGSDLTFTEDDFSGVFSDPDGDSPTRVRIVTLPGAGQLFLGDQPVTAGDEIALSDLVNLVFKVPSGDFPVEVSFTWQARDCTDWSPEALVKLFFSDDDTGGGGGGTGGDGGGGGCFLSSIM